jgi:alkaline phosphatase
MEPFTEDDYLHARDTAISKILPPAERRHKAQVASLAERAARRAERDGAPEPVAEGTRRSTRLQTDISYAESSPETPSPVDSSPGFKSSDKSESYSPSPRGIKRKRTTKDKDEEVKPGAKRRNTKRVIDSDEEMKDITSRSRSVTPAPPIKKHSKRVTTLVDSDDEMDESPTGRVSTSRSRSATPAPPVKKRKVEGKRVTTLADSDEEIE